VFRKILRRELDFIKKLDINGLIPEIPIIQGGMAVGVSLDGLASAVANEGGIGIIGTAGIGLVENISSGSVRRDNLEGLKNVIRRAKEKTKGIIGVNIMVALSDYSEMVKTAIKENVDLIISGAGLPLSLPSFLGETSKTKLVPIVSSLKSAQIIFKKWMKSYGYIPDAFIVEGPQAGGHLGYREENLEDENYSLETTVPQVVKFSEEIFRQYGKKVPVIAAGGIDSREKAQKMFMMGASGIQVGTPFIATKECDADIKFKQTVINASEEDIKIIKSPVGLPGRAVKNKFLEEVERGIQKPFRCAYQCIKTCKVTNAPYCIAQALLNAAKGNMEKGFAFTGSNGYKIKEITDVKTVIKTIIG